MSEAEKEAEETIGIIELSRSITVYELLQWLSTHNNLQYNFTRDGFDAYLRAEGRKIHGKAST